MPRLNAPNKLLKWQENTGTQMIQQNGRLIKIDLDRTTGKKTSIDLDL